MVVLAQVLVAVLAQVLVAVVSVLDLVLDLIVPVARPIPHPHETAEVTYRVRLERDDPAAVRAKAVSRICGSRPAA